MSNHILSSVSLFVKLSHTRDNSALKHVKWIVRFDNNGPQTLFHSLLLNATELMTVFLNENVLTLI